MLLDSLSRESDETHLLMKEIATAGLTHSSVAYTILRELKMAKNALYEVKCELRKSDAVVNKNNLLHAVRDVHINEHYIGKLSTTNRKVLIRQANEANERLVYVDDALGTNDDAPKDATLKYLLEPLKTEDEAMGETEHLDGPEYPQIPKDAFYEVKIELRKSDAITDKNNLLYTVKVVHINEHYIGKLSTTHRKVLIRQANEANRLF